MKKGCLRDRRIRGRAFRVHSAKAFGNRAERPPRDVDPSQILAMSRNRGGEGARHEDGGDQTRWRSLSKNTYQNGGRHVKNSAATNP